MAPSEGMSDFYIGRKIVLISKAGLSYTGVLEAMNMVDSTLTFKNVQVEGRTDKDGVKEPPKVYESIVFGAADIQDLRVVDESPANRKRSEDPAVLRAVPSNARPTSYANAVTGNRAPVSGERDGYKSGARAPEVRRDDDRYGNRDEGRRDRGGYDNRNGESRGYGERQARGYDQGRQDRGYDAGQGRGYDRGERNYDRQDRSDRNYRGYERNERSYNDRQGSYNDRQSSYNDRQSYNRSDRPVSQGRQDRSGPSSYGNRQQARSGPRSPGRAGQWQERRGGHSARSGEDRGHIGELQPHVSESVKASVKSDFDFAAANARMSVSTPGVGEAVSDNSTASESAKPQVAPVYNKTKSFFDNLSNEFSAKKTGTTSAAQSSDQQQNGDPNRSASQRPGSYDQSGSRPYMRQRLSKEDKEKQHQVDAETFGLEAVISNYARQRGGPRRGPRDGNFGGYRGGNYSRNNDSYRH